MDLLTDAVRIFIKELPLLDDVLRVSPPPTDFADPEPVIKCNLAARYGKLKDHLKGLDDKMKTMIGITMQALSKLDKKMEWDKIVECMMNNPALLPLDEEEVDRYKEVHKETSKWFSYASIEPADDDPVVRQMEVWIQDLISDEDIISDLSFDPKTYAKFVSCSGASVTGLVSAINRGDKKEKAVLDVGVLRYPEMDKPYFKVYRVSLYAFVDSSGGLLGNETNSGLIGKFSSKKFGVREEFVKDIKKETVEKAHANVEALFD